LESLESSFDRETRRVIDKESIREKPRERRNWTSEGWRLEKVCRGEGYGQKGIWTRDKKKTKEKDAKEGGGSMHKGLVTQARYKIFGGAK